MKRPGPLVSAAWLAARLEKVVVADVRWYLDGRSGRAAYDRGHLPGAVFVDLDDDLSAPPGSAGRHPLPSPQAFADAMSALGFTNDSVVVAYDDANGLVAARFWWMLDSIGVQAAVLDGGIDAWHGDLETTDTALPRSSFDPRPWPTERFVTADDVQARSADVLLIDARSAERYSGEPNQIDPRFGHIPGALNAPFTAQTSEHGGLRPASDLAQAFAELGINADTEVIAYCGSGVSACGDLLALTEAGMENLRLYVGSWSEWGADTSRPLET